jgi:hypothetical protein
MGCFALQKQVLTIEKIVMARMTLHWPTNRCKCPKIKKSFFMGSFAFQKQVLTIEKIAMATMTLHWPTNGCKCPKFKKVFLWVVLPFKSKF